MRSMRFGKVDFPKLVVDTARKRELVVFAGAGVSMRKPARLPRFRELAEQIAKQAGEREPDIKNALKNDEPDMYLGKLQDQAVQVRALAARVLSEKDLCPTDLHRVLLSLYPSPDTVRIVTTNFDPLFERAVPDVFPEATPEELNVRCLPELPAESHFRGIVHLHGSMEETSSMVLTDKDFGAAYLSGKPRASKFVVDLLSENTLLFVGYSGDDVVFRYLTRGLSAPESAQAFAMVRAGDEQKWLKLGIQPVSYPTLPGDPDGALCESLSRLAKHAGAGPAEQRSRIGELASQSPSELDREQIDLVVDALSDSVRRKFFTHAADSFEWIVWLDSKKYLDSLFRGKDLSESDLELARWLAQKFMYGDTEELFALISRHGTRLHVDFWEQLLLQVIRRAEAFSDSNSLERWISLLLSTAPRHTHRFYLFLLGQRCIESGLTDTVTEIFEILAAGHLKLQKTPFVYHTVEKAASNLMTEFSPVSKPHDLGDLWQKGLQPQLPRIASRVLPVLVENLAKQHRALLTWGNASRHLDTASFRRHAIEPHDQNHHPDAADAVIDATRDCLQWLAVHDRDAALHWCERLADEQAPLLRRLATHTLTEFPDVPSFGPDEKINWLLSRGAISDDAARHEVIRAMRLAYPRASRVRRKAVVDAVLDLLPDEKESDGDTVAYGRFKCFNWLYWLHRSATDCNLVGKVLKQIRTEYPDFRPHEYFDFISWSRTGGIAQRVESLSPWPADQLLAEPASRWISRLLEYCPKGSPLEGTPWARQGLHRQVAEAVRKNFEWGVDLADELAKGRKWEVDLWKTLLVVWAEADENKILARHVLRHLRQDELRSEHSAAIVDLLCAWAQSGRHAKLLDEADRIATELWPVLLWDDENLIRTNGIPDWLMTALNLFPGILAQFWLERFNVRGLYGECRAALSAIVRDPSVPGRLGRTILARNFSVLLQKEEEWAEENLLPFFELREDKDAADCQAVWEGFLNRPHIDAKIFTVMQNAFYAGMEQFHGKRFILTEELYKRFLGVCAGVAMDRSCIPDPLEKWLPQVLRNCRAQDKGVFVSKLCEALKEMGAQEREESWHRWLKEYWQGRQLGAFAGGPLTPEETRGMFHWLPLLRGTEFKEAVDLAVGTAPVPNLQHSFLLRELDEAGLCEEQPEAMAKLLLCLGKTEVIEYEWQEEGGEMIRKLRASGISSVLKDELEDLMALHDIPVMEGDAA